MQDTDTHLDLFPRKGRRRGGCFGMTCKGKWGPQEHKELMACLFLEEAQLLLYSGPRQPREVNDVGRHTKPVLSPADENVLGREFLRET
jgi:hypothetical protein